MKRGEFLEARKEKKAFLKVENSRAKSFLLFKGPGREKKVKSVCSKHLVFKKKSSFLITFREHLEESLSFGWSIENKNHFPSPHEEPNLKQRGESVIFPTFVIGIFLL